MIAYLLPDKGSLNVIRRSLVPFGNPVGFPTRSDLMAKPTPASRLSSLLRYPKECVASANFFDLPYLCKASLTQGSYTYLYPISTKFSSNKSRSTLWSIWPSTVHTGAHIPCANFQRYHLCLSFLFSAAKRDPR